MRAYSEERVLQYQQLWQKRQNQTKKVLSSKLCPGRDNAPGGVKDQSLK